MTQPVSNWSPSYTPYDPSLEQSRADGGAGGASAVSSGGAEGAGGSPNAQPAPIESQPDPACVNELMKTIAACGGAYLSTRFPSPATPLAMLNCAANALDFLECVHADPTLTRAP
jgi:hypothetical protein